MADYPYSTMRWQRVRKRQLLLQPLCTTCLAEHRITQAVEVDHIQTIKSGGAPFDPRNLQSMCHSHHSMKTNYDMQGKDFSTYALRGCNEDGSPKYGGDQSLQPRASGAALRPQNE
jgi:hypothetical protein